MNAILLTVLALSGAGNTNAAIHHHDSVIEGDCEACAKMDHLTQHRVKAASKPLTGSVLGPMPQQCYDPSYGCYQGTRHMNRYPAFHQTYYRRPYNYRNVFDYPWHAALHEPTSHFSFHATGDTGLAPVPHAAPQPAPAPKPAPAAKPMPTVPQPAPASAAEPFHSEIRRASRISFSDTSEEPQAANPLRTLRR